MPRLLAKRFMSGVPTYFPMHVSNTKDLESRDMLDESQATSCDTLLIASNVSYESYRSALQFI